MRLLHRLVLVPVPDLYQNLSKIQRSDNGAFGKLNSVVPLVSKQLLFSSFTEPPNQSAEYGRTEQDLVHAEPMLAMCNT